MSPPHVPGIPGTKLPSPAVEEEPARGSHHDLRAELEESLPAPPKVPESEAPARGVKMSGKGWSVTLPIALVTSVLSAIGMHFVAPGGVPADDELRRDVREIRSDARESRDALRAEIRDLRDQLQREKQFTHRDVPIIVETMKRQPGGPKLDWKDGWVADVDFYPAPLGGAAPLVQPRVALEPPPSSQ